MKFSVIDIEGTGGKAGKSRIMEIAVYVYDDETDTVIDEFSTLVNPGKNPDPYVRKMTGITPKMLKRAPAFHEIAKRLVKMTERTVIAAHNAGFDYDMLRSEFRRLGYDFKRPVIDTEKWAKALMPDIKSYGLDALARLLKIPAVDRHRAFGDARLTLEILKILRQKDPDKKVFYNLLRDDGEIKPVPELKIRKIIDRLPHRPGILYAYDRQGKLLYAKYHGDLKFQAEKILSATGGRRGELAHATAKMEGEVIYSRFIGKVRAQQIRKRLHPPFSLPFPVENGSVLPEKTLLLLDKGRHQNEKSVVLVENGKLTGYAFVRLNWQMENPEELKARLTPLNDCPYGRKLLAEYLNKHYFEEVVEMGNDMLNRFNR